MSAGNTVVSGERPYPLLAGVVDQCHHTGHSHMSDASHAGQRMSNVSLLDHNHVTALPSLDSRIICLAFIHITMNSKQHHLVVTEEPFLIKNILESNIF